MKIAIGSDHAAFKVKDAIKKFLLQKEYEVEDMGTYTEQSCDYPDYALKVASEVSEKKVDVGILICGTGIGVSITANKVPSIRAALCHSAETARLSREHNDANVLCLGARILSEKDIFEIVETWLSTNFSGNRHKKRVEKITAIEKKFSRAYG